MNRNDELHVTDDDRLREVARLLAAAILRHRARAALPVEQLSAVKNLPKCAQKGLEVSEETVLSGHGG